MDLLFNAYSNTSDDDDEEQPKRQRLSLSSFDPPKPLRPLPSPSNLQTQPPIPGSYVSKRQRALLAPLPSLPEPVTLPSSFTLSGSISDVDIPHSILSLLKHKAKGHQNLNSIPEKLSVALYGHSKAVNAIHWSSTYDLAYSSSPCICWDGSYGLHMECMEQRSEKSMCVKLPQCSSERCEMVSARALSAFLWL